MPWLSLLLAAGALGQPLVDTVGHTDRDRQVYGPAVRYIVNDPLRGVHIVWKAGPGSIRYNFRARGEGWRWNDGIPVNRYPRNLGSMDVDFESGTPTIGVDFVSRGEHRIAYFRDTAPGAGSFVETAMDFGGYQHNIVAASDQGRVRFAALLGDSVYYRTTHSYRLLGTAGAFPGHNVFASRQVGRFGYAWATSTPDSAGALVLAETPNNGSQWYANVILTDSVPSPYRCCLLGASGVYDSTKLELVTCLYDGVDRSRSELWHYAKYDSPPWYLIQHVELPRSVDIGTEALAACRPSIGREAGGRALFVVWEQFDPENVDPVTELARADIWACRTLDRCQRWSRPVRLTTPDETSKRFPCLADVVDDTLRIVYFADRVAGFSEAGQGPSTSNPVVYLRVPVDILFPGSACELPPGVLPDPGTPWVTPTISATTFTLRSPRAGPVEVYDASGRLRSIVPPGDERSVFGAGLAPGAYFIRPASAGPLRQGPVRIIKLR